jgi:hypothetical protein
MGSSRFDVREQERVYALGILEGYRVPRARYDGEPRVRDRPRHIRGIRCEEVSFASDHESRCGDLGERIRARI